MLMGKRLDLVTAVEQATRALHRFAHVSRIAAADTVPGQPPSRFLPEHLPIIWRFIWLARPAYWLRCKVRHVHTWPPAGDPFDSVVEPMPEDWAGWEPGAVVRRFYCWACHRDIGHYV
ncbi:MAG: hypothetical protein OXI12_12885 [Gammaproteobacteria bacterium]|nr:hypothetical protein [Gammaproteobacteria bacterium]